MVKRWHVMTSMAVAIVCGGLLASFASTGATEASASKGVARGATPVSTLAVAVDRHGEVVRSTAAGITAERSSNGVYVITFPVNVRDCIYAISIADDNSTGVPPTGFVTAGPKSRNPTDVFVTTENRQGDLAGRPFHLTVTCRA
jgi:hypothetical protein